MRRQVVRAGKPHILINDYGVMVQTAIDGRYWPWMRTGYLNVPRDRRDALNTAKRMCKAYHKQHG